MGKKAKNRLAGDIRASLHELRDLVAGKAFPEARTIDELRRDPDFQENAADAVVAAVPFRAEVAAADLIF